MIDYCKIMTVNNAKSFLNKATQQNKEIIPHTPVKSNSVNKTNNMSRAKQTMEQTNTSSATPFIVN